MRTQISAKLGKIPVHFSLRKNTLFQFLAILLIAFSMQACNKNDADSTGATLKRSVEDCPLCIYFNSVNAATQGCDVTVSWNYNMESPNSSVFQLERSFDGTNFSVVATINGNPGQTGQSYSYTNYNSNTTSFYRVVNIDQDGNKKYSQVISAGTTGSCNPANTLEGSFRITPSNGKIFIYFEGGWKHILNWETYSGCFDLDWTSTHTPGYGVDPNPVTGVFNGYLGMQGTTGDVYFITPMPVPMIPIGRRIASPSVFDRYHFDWHKIKRNLGNSFSTTGLPIY